jgi:hypothetical protein
VADAVALPIIERASPDDLVAVVDQQRSGRETQPECKNASQALEAADEPVM